MKTVSVESTMIEVIRSNNTLRPTYGIRAQAIIRHGGSSQLTAPTKWFSLTTSGVWGLKFFNIKDSKAEYGSGEMAKLVEMLQALGLEVEKEGIMK